MTTVTMPHLSPYPARSVLFTEIVNHPYKGHRLPSHTNLKHTIPFWSFCNWIVSSFELSEQFNCSSVVVGISPISTTWCPLLHIAASSARAIDSWPENTWTNSNVRDSPSSCTYSNGAVAVIDWRYGSSPYRTVTRDIASGASISSPQVLARETAAGATICSPSLRDTWLSWGRSRGVLGGVKGISFLRDNLLCRFSLWISGDCGRIVDVEAGAVDNRLRESADDDGQCATGGRKLSFGWRYLFDLDALWILFSRVAFSLVKMILRPGHRSTGTSNQSGKIHFS
jgi:hypothetical protein